MPRREILATSMMHIETMFALAAEGPLVAEWEALENVFYIVTLLRSLMCTSLLATVRNKIQS